MNAEHDVELSFQALEVYGVPRARARSVHNGIEVLATRFRKGVRDVCDTERAGLTKAIRILESLPEGKQHRDHGIEVVRRAMESPHMSDPVVVAYSPDNHYEHVWEGPRSLIPPGYYETRLHGAG